MKRYLTKTLTILHGIWKVYIEIPYIDDIDTISYSPKFIRKIEPMPLVTRTYKNSIKIYDKKTLLRALCMYNKFHYDTCVPTPRNQLCAARFKHGTQFLIDLFILSEVYMSHFPKFAMHKLRTDITFILNTTPDYRLKFEENSK